MNQIESSPEEKLLSFIREAFVIDGECKFISKVPKDDMVALSFVLRDSKRGEFFITLTKKDN